LREKKPETKAAQIRALWPDIRTVLDNGHSLKTVCECLAADGIEVTVQSLGSYLARIRKRSARLEMIASQALPQADDDSTVPMKDCEPTQTLANAGERPAARDPLANVRERQAKRPAFDYRPELADSKDLI
jgi:hypothetical protein